MELKFPPTLAVHLQGWLGRSDFTLHEGQAQLVRWSDALSGSIVAWGSDKAVWVSLWESAGRVTRGGNKYGRRGK